MKILYVTTISNTVNAFLIPHIRMLVDEGHQVDIAFNLVQEVKKDLLDLNINIYQIPFNRSPLSIDNLKAYKELKKLVLNEKYDIVHTHTPIASAIVRFVCKDIKETRVFYTAHGFHFHKGAPILNWLIYYPLEKYLSKYTDILITINKEDYERAKTSFYSNEIEYIPGVGINLEKIHNIKVNRVEKRKELNIPNDAFVILSVGELNKNKNHEVVIKALSELKNTDVHYLICGEGPLEEYLRNLVNELKIEMKVHFLGFRYDVIEIYKVVDLFIFPSFREGLPVSLIEAMASNLPCLASQVRGNEDLVEISQFGDLFKPDSKDELKLKIIKMIDRNKINKNIVNKNLENSKKYELDRILENLRGIMYN